MELSELSLRVGKLEEIIQALAKWTNFNLNTNEEGSLELDKIDWKTTRQNKKKNQNPRFVSVTKSSVSNAVEEDAEDPMSSVVIKMEEEEEFGNIYNCEEVTNKGEDLPEDSVEWTDRLSNSDEDPPFIPSDGGVNSESASDFEGVAERPKKRRKRSYKPLKVLHKTSFSSETFASLRPLQLPKKKKDQEPNDLKCPSCPTRIFTNKTGLTRHIRAGICQRTFPCPHHPCPFVSGIKANLSYHIKSLHPATEEERLQRPFKCPQCPKTFRFKNKLRTHINYIHNGKTFLCDFCPYLGKNYNSFRQHLTNNHKEFSFSCYFCPWKGRILNKLTNHLRIHTGEKPYKCPHCIYTSTTDEGLRTHLKRLHLHGKEEGSGSFQCEKCPNRFKTQGSLVQHLQMHDGTAYKCVICGFEGFNEASLREHLKCHKTEDGQMLKCPHCPKAYKKRREMTFHLRTHTGEKPYKCGKCEYASIRKDSLKKHEKICKGKSREENKDLKDGEELPEQNATSAPTTAQYEENYWNELHFLCKE